MKRLTTTLIILFVIYFSIQILFNKFGNGHNISYTLSDATNSFNINEKYVANTKGETNNYYLTIEIGETIFDLQTYADFSGVERIVKSVQYYSDDNYKCILPIFSGNKKLFDLTCLKDNILTPYSFLRGANANLDVFVNSLPSTTYNISQWQDNDVDAIIDGSLTLYPNNIVKKHYVAINNYRGLYTINADNIKKINNVRLFDFDVYKRPLSGVVGKYYITADYGQEYSFNQFSIVDLMNNNVTQITLGTRIDFDAYIQGVVDNSMYIFDRENKKQYEISVKNMTSTEVGNVDAGIKVYQDGIWSNASAYDAANSDLLFDTKPVVSVFTGFDRVDKVGNTLSGFYYLYKKQSNKYFVYRTNIQNPTIKTLLFITNKIDDVLYVKDYVYFTSDNAVKYFNDANGVKTLFKNSEFDFNNSLYFNVYSK